MSNYIKFYNVVDRENKYSNTNKKENHPAYKDLEYCINNKYNLRNHRTLEIGSGKPFKILQMTIMELYRRKLREIL